LGFAILGIVVEEDLHPPGRFHQVLGRVGGGEYRPLLVLWGLLLLLLLLREEEEEEEGEGEGVESWSCKCAYLLLLLLLLPSLPPLLPLLLPPALLLPLLPHPLWHDLGDAIQEVGTGLCQVSIVVPHQSILPCHIAEYLRWWELVEGHGLKGRYYMVSSSSSSSSSGSNGAMTMTMTSTAVE